jgi:hypothetical protein
MGNANKMSKPSTVSEMEKALRETKTIRQGHKVQHKLHNLSDFDEVFPRVFISGRYNQMNNFEIFILSAACCLDRRPI